MVQFQRFFYFTSEPYSLPDAKTRFISFRNAKNALLLLLANM
jgi:hypothetical protein